MTSKPSNPKDAVGIHKVPFSTVPAQIVAWIGLAMLEGARKYGRHNYRVVGVRASVYYDAAMRHLAAWWEGQDTDPASGLPHLMKAAACLTVIQDAVDNDRWADDRPPALSNQQWVEEMNELAAQIIERIPDSKEPHVKEAEQALQTAIKAMDCPRYPGRCVA